MRHRQAVASEQPRCFNVTTPLKAWNVLGLWLRETSRSPLQCDHAVEGVEWPARLRLKRCPPRFNVTTPLKAWNGRHSDAANGGTYVLQCDHAVEGVECKMLVLRRPDGIASM